MTQSTVQAFGFAQPASRTFNDTYMRVLCVALGGYAVVGKTFAYIGVPPLYLGELLLITGFLTFVRTGCWLASIATPAARILLVLMAWVVLRTVPYVGTYGADALRDSVIVTYGFFCFIVIALLLEDPGRLDRAIVSYYALIRVYAFIGGGCSALALAKVTIPGTNLQIIDLSPGAIATHLAGAAAFAILGLGRFSRIWVAMLLVSMVMVTSSRGAMLACIVAILASAILGGRLRQLVPVVAFAAVALAIASLLDINVRITPEGRAIGADQIIEALKSILGVSDASNYEATKEFRTRWWSTIQDYTFRGPYFWSGKGFGVNIAMEDGYQLWATTEGLRSPHNASMTILSRAGVPGLLLWVSLFGTWFTMLIRSMLMAQRRNETRWAKIFIWIASYGAAIIIEASFNVTLEGPMVGIWFWCLFGFGIAASMMFRSGLISEHAPDEMHRAE
ncbi:O-antigen ligase family protein [Methylobacterium gnaphalii]|uniref:O-antigen ligase-related domain-containing protein n=1 Tax=Methylobacterium gnaphalii TaxID=1010610 RepID=A0A512JNU8_9HYPH|nr:O-antigen ligase family protein [Methylobacterium gnaphalii]GEP11608.1 hypothetical protein MGN01_34530 [Methylobacterium gnaphalii]GJD69589.1 hypothetical protein MMMDOFMJ_2526 [Methylobacterium gnaphalii]GLS49129.1 hypothetical protein GCM10007885_19770 [Methylobacterium gnaphalii]